MAGLLDLTNSNVSPEGLMPQGRTPNVAGLCLVPHMKRGRHARRRIYS